MAVAASMITYKIGLIWHHENPLYYHHSVQIVLVCLVKQEPEKKLFNRRTELPSRVGQLSLLFLSFFLVSGCKNNTQKCLSKFFRFWSQNS